MKRRALFPIILCICIIAFFVITYFFMKKPDDAALFRARIDNLMPIDKATLYEGDYFRETTEQCTIKDILDMVYSSIGKEHDTDEEIIAPPPGGSQLSLVADSGTAGIVFVYEQDYIPCDFYCRIIDFDKHTEEVFCFSLRKTIKEEIDRLMGEEKKTMGDVQ